MCTLRSPTDMRGAAALTLRQRPAWLQGYRHDRPVAIIFSKTAQEHSAAQQMMDLGCMLQSRLPSGLTWKARATGKDCEELSLDGGPHGPWSHVPLPLTVGKSFLLIEGLRPVHVVHCSQQAAVGPCTHKPGTAKISISSYQRECEKFCWAHAGRSCSWCCC